MDNSNINIDLIRGHVDTIIMRSIFERDKYGLEILNEITSKSDGLYSLKQPTLYSCLKRLEKQGYIRSYKGDSSNGAPRVYYSLLDEGKNFLLNDQYQWEYSRTIINNLLSDKDFDKSQDAPFQASALRPLTRRQGVQSTSNNNDDETNDSSDDDDTENSYCNEVSNSNIDNKILNSTKTKNDNNDGNFIINQNLNSFDNSYNVKNNSFSKNNDDCAFTSNNSFHNTTNYYQSPKPELKSSNLYDFKQKETPLFADDTAIKKTSSNQVSHGNVISNLTNENYSKSYIDSFSSIYNVNEPRQTTLPKVEENYEKNNYNSLSINEMKAELEKDGFTIKQYIKKNSTDYYSGKYYYKNKLLLLSSFVFFILVLIEILSIFFSLQKSATPMPTAFLGTILALVSLLPIYAVIKFLNFKTQKNIARFNVKTAIINTLILIINLTAIILLVGYFAFNADFNNISTLILPIILPIGLLLNIPLFIIIYDIIYKSKIMHIR